MFSNICTSIDSMNEARYQAVNIIPDENGMSNFRKVDNLTNGYSNLL